MHGQQNVKIISIDWLPETISGIFGISNAAARCICHSVAFIPSKYVAA